MSVRRAGPDDAPALAQLRWQWRADERGEVGLGRDEFVAAFAGWMAEHATSHLAWLAEDRGEPAGMAWLAVVHRPPGPGTWLRLAGTLQSVYVRPASRGHGVGAALVAAAIGEARFRGLDYLSVHPSEPSFPLYRRAGFHETSGVLEVGLTRPRRDAR